jgi:23S rRNA G2445 N2-methylase RlmL
MRVGAGRDLRNLYAQFGNVLRRSCPGWQVALLGNDRQLPGQMGLRLEPRLALVNGGIPVQLLLGAVSQAA